MLLFQLQQYRIIVGKNYINNLNDKKQSMVALHHDSIAKINKI